MRGERAGHAHKVGYLTGESGGCVCSYSKSFVCFALLFFPLYPNESLPLILRALIHTLFS